MEDVTIGLALAAGLLSFVSPCVLPLVPAYIGYMGGRATRNVALEKSKTDGSSATVAFSARANMLLHGLAFVLGFTFVFVSLGLMTTAFISLLGGSVNILTEVIGRVGGIVIIIFGLHFMGVLRWFFGWLRKHPAVLNNPGTTPLVAVVIVVLSLWAFITPIVALPVIAAVLLTFFLGGGFTHPGEFWESFLNRFENAIYADTRRDIEPDGKGGLAGSFFMGVVFSAGWTPCIGPLLGSILTVAATTGNSVQAVPLLTAYSLGLGIPFMLTALLFEGAQSLLRRLQRYMHAIELVSGGLLVVIGVLIASGQLQSLSTTLSTEQADVSLRIEECGIGFLDGRLHLNQIGSCLDGDLHLVAVNQSAIGAVNSDVAQIEYVFNVEAAEVVAVELDRLRVFDANEVDDDGDPMQVDVMATNETLDIELTLIDDDGTVYVTSSDLIFLEEDEFLAILPIELPEAGQYTIIVTHDNPAHIEADFRLRVREAALSEVEDLTDNQTGTDTDGAVSSLATQLGSIEDLADETVAVEGLALGNRAPDFTITTIEGEEVALSDLRGQIVLLNFWGTWCGPCRREMPDFQQVYEEYSDEGFTILALAVQGDTEADVVEFQDEFGLTFPLAVDEGDVINDQYNVLSQPSTFILDEDGVIVFRNFGLVVESQLSEILVEQLDMEEAAG